MRDAVEIQGQIFQYIKQIERTKEFIAMLDSNGRRYKPEMDSALKRIALYSDRIWELQWALGEVG